MSNRREEVKAFVQSRKTAYQQVFEGDGNVASKAVLSDLERFCRHSESCFNADPRIHALLEGRREVVLRIKDFLTLPVEELCRKYHGEGWTHGD